MTTPNTQGASWEQIKQRLAQVLVDEGVAVKNVQLENKLWSVFSSAEKLLSKERAEGERREQKLLDALESMYEQYCSHGHSFMRAGEYASAVLKEYGYSFDGGGRLKSYPTLPADSTEKH